MKWDTHFTAAQYAGFLGLTRQGVAKALAKCSSIEKETAGGQRAAAWPVSALPHKWQITLNTISRDRGYRGPEHLLSDPGTPWLPEVPLSLIGSADVAAAKERCALLAPLLCAHSDKPIAALAKMAAELPDSRLRAERTFWQWIHNAVKRDGGRSEWQRWEIYLDDGIKPRADADPGAGRPKPVEGIESEAAPIWSEVDRWESACRSLAQLQEAGEPYKKARKKVIAQIESAGVPLAADRDYLRKKLDTYWERYKEHGRDGLMDQRAVNSGRKPLVTLTPEELIEAKRLYIETESKTTALRMLAGSGKCRPEIATAILKKRASKHTITPALREVISLPAAVRAYHKSPKNVRVNSFINPRTLTYIDAGGIEQPLRPGDLFERDDMSNNFLCWVPWPWGGDPCSDKYGVRLARGQNLLMIDVRSLKLISFNFLVRLRDSYRADDIWQWVGQTYRDFGLPHIGERWERGTWKSRLLRGADDKIEGGCIDEALRLGGMSALGLKVIESHSPTTKVIEGRFRFFQTACKTIHGQIGAKRGEMERENKHWTACRLGYKDPRDYFLSFDQAADAIEEKMHWVNSQPVEGLSYHGVPDEVWAAGIAANPLRPLDPARGFLFARNKREIKVRKGHVLVRRTDADGFRSGSYFYHEDLYRFEGVAMSVYLDEYALTDGAMLVVKEGPKAGHVIGQANLVEGCPQFALGFQTGEETSAADAMLEALDRKKGFGDAVRSEYRALGVNGARIARSARVDDGAGREATISQRSAVSLASASREIRGTPAEPLPDGWRAGGMISALFEDRDGGLVMDQARTLRTAEGQNTDTESPANKSL